MTAPDSVAPAAPEKSASFWEDFVDIFFAPAAVFARRRASGFWGALLLYAALTTGLSLVARPAMQPIFDQMSAQQLEKMRQSNPQMTQEQLDKARAFGEKFSTPTFLAVFTFVGSTVTMLVLGVVVWGVSRLFGVPLLVTQGIGIAVYASIPRLLTFALVTALTFIRPLGDGATMSSFTLSPAMFMGGASQMTQAILARFDVGVLWATALIGVGVAVVGRRERSQGMTVAGVVWVLGTLMALLNVWRATAG